MFQLTKVMVAKSAAVTKKQKKNDLLTNNAKNFNIIVYAQKLMT